MIWSFVFVGITLLISLLTNVVSTWIEPKLQRAKGTIVIFLLILSFFSGLYLDKKDVQFPDVQFPVDLFDIPKTVHKDKNTPNNPNVVEDQDGNVYPIFKFSGKIWLGKNLNINVKDSFCYDEDDSKCLVCGKHYTYDAAVNACNTLGENWRLITTSDIKELLISNGGGYEYSKGLFGENEVVGNILQGQKNMTDNNGFNAVNGGMMIRSYFVGIEITKSLQFGTAGWYWLAPSIGDKPSPYAYVVQESSIFPAISGGAFTMPNNMYSCRCVRDSI